MPGLQASDFVISEDGDRISELASKQAILHRVQELDKLDAHGLLVLHGHMAGGKLQADGGEIDLLLVLVQDETRRNLGFWRDHVLVAADVAAVC